MARTRNSMLQAVPSSVVVSSAMTARGITVVATLTKSKEIVITFPGNYLIKFVLNGSATNLGIDGRIYKNGIAFGTLRTTNARGEEFSETLGPWDRGDLCQLYVAYNAGAGTQSVSGFRIMGSYNNDSGIPIPAGKVTVDTAV